LQACQSIGGDVFVLKPYNDVYEEVVKPLLEKSKLDLELGFSAQSPLVVFGICCWILFSAIWCFLLDSIQGLPLFNIINLVFCFHHPLNKQIDLM
jgi:hypothetical protein